MDLIYKATIAMTGLSVFGINIYNIPYDKISVRNRSEQQRLYFKYYMVSMLKGCIYGSTSPVSLFIMLINSVHRDPFTFKRHLIPCSVYFKDDFDNRN